MVCVCVCACVCACECVCSFECVCDIVCVHDCDMKSSSVQGKVRVTSLYMPLGGI